MIPAKNLAFPWATILITTKEVQDMPVYEGTPSPLSHEQLELSSDKQIPSPVARTQQGAQ